MVITLRSVLYQIIPIVVIVSLLVISMTLLDMSTESPQNSNEYNDWIIPLNILILAILFILILFNFFRAISLLKAKRAGSRFTLRLMSAFSILTIIPVVVVSYFSMDFMGNRIDNYFNVQIERALGDSLELAERSLKNITAVHLRDIEITARQLFRLDKADYSYFLTEEQENLNADEVILLDSQKRIISYSSTDTGNLFDKLPEDRMFTRLALDGFYSEIEPDGEGNLYSRVAVTMQKDAMSNTYILTALFPITHKHTVLSESVLAAQEQYKQLKLQRNSIKYGFRFGLFIIMVLSVLLALWAAFAYSKRLTQPVRTLLEGTLSVASGNLQTKLPVSDKDDFSLLARSFNTMTSRLLSARHESEESRLEVQRQHDYLNVVLNHLTSGVLTIDDKYIIRRINAAATQMLKISVEDAQGKTLQELIDNSSLMSALVEEALPHIENNEEEWQLEFTTMQDNKQQVFVCQGATLPDLLDGEKATVVVFDDITDLIQAEHDAAWSEVAQRLAHEIKNPLTPIQLSAERLRYRLLPKLDEESGELLIRMSETITQQVESMKTMVNAFSDYARTPALQFQKVDLKKLIIDVTILYQSNLQDVKLDIDIDDLPEISIDVHRMRQVLVNLIKNSIEAVESAQDERIVHISAYVSESDEIIIKVADNGPGIDEKLLPKLFDPYISSKSKGSGLGLAIVKKIIEEHSGNIVARNNESKGAEFTIMLPIT